MITTKHHVPTHLAPVGPDIPAGVTEVVIPVEMDESVEGRRRGREVSTGHSLRERERQPLGKVLCCGVRALEFPDAWNRSYDDRACQTSDLTRIARTSRSASKTPRRAPL